jgi:hypothetical protein
MEDSLNTTCSAYHEIQKNVDLLNVQLSQYKAQQQIYSQRIHELMKEMGLEEVNASSVRFSRQQKPKRKPRQSLAHFQNLLERHIDDPVARHNAVSELLESAVAGKGAGSDDDGGEILVRRIIKKVPAHK